MKTVRCAIYTRKSSDEGLDQEFNSLHAQREACAAYILSQASEGWTALKDQYDDGGISGGTLERPALRRLMADVAAGKIDVIVVYKVDRLSRSLFDFAKLIEAFEKAGTSFVSITQSFNTTSSMGRLTLNMLLSFAQFEREVTAERIRDKISASKAKGMWMGGIPPLGYKPNGRSLSIIEEDAVTVRMIFKRYLELGNVRRLAERLARDGVRTPRHTTQTGKVIGGAQYYRGQLYNLLKNRIYLGEIVHGGKIYPGLHAAILDRDLFDRVQSALASNQQGTHPQTNASNRALLAGKIFDGRGTPLVSSHACKGTKRYRYYVSKDRQKGRSKLGLRLPALSIERSVIDRIVEALREPIDLLEYVNPAAVDLGRFLDRCRELAEYADRQEFIRIVSEVQVVDDRIDITCDSARLAELLGVTLTLENAAPLKLSIAGGFRWRRGFRLVTSDGVMADAQKDRALTRLIAQGRGWWSELRKGQLTVSEIARREGIAKSYVSRVVRLAFLAPAVVEASISHRLLAHVDGSIKLRGFPAAWKKQEHAMLPRSAAGRYAELA